MDQRTDSHSNHSAHLRVVQYCLDFSGTVESIGEFMRVLEQYVSFRAAVEFFTVTVKGLVTPANGYVSEGKRTKVCRIWLSGDKSYLLCRSKFSRSVCGAWKLSNDRTSTGHVTGKTHDNRMCTG